jgi:hypothetical protein
VGFHINISRKAVQSGLRTEPRKEGGIETTVYVRGAVIHSLKTSQKEFLQSPEYTDDKFKRLLEDQHRLVIGRIRSGEIAPAAPARA